MEEERISREEEVRIDKFEDEIDEIENDYFFCNACRCNDSLIDELETRNRIRSVVLPGTMLYDAGDIRKFMMFISMYPAFATVSEVVEDMTAHYDESEIE